MVRHCFLRYYALASLVTVTEAYLVVVPSPCCQNHHHCRASTPRTTSALLSSSSPSEESDELSRLIEKRASIKRKKKEEQEEPQTPPEPTVDLDLDSLPQFKTERPVRNKEPQVEEQPKPGKDENLPIVDFKADYEDENDFHIPNRMGFSTVAWGDTRQGFVASGKLTKRMIKAGKYVPGDLQLAFNQLLEGGITLVETAPSYGIDSLPNKLSAEYILQRCLEESEGDLPEVKLVGGLGASAWTKLLPSSMVNSLNGSCERLGQSSVELFHVPKSPLYPSTLLVNALVGALEAGSCNYVGVEGVTRPSTLRKLQRKLDDNDLVLTSNMFEFSLTNTKNEMMITACKDMGVIPLISNPLDGGLASGVYTASNPSGGKSGTTAKYTFKQLEALQPLHSVQETLTDRVRTRVLRESRDTAERFRGRYGPAPKINTDITTTQIALNYIVAKGGVPLVPVIGPADAKEILGCLGWSLSDDEVDMLDAAIALCKL